MPDGMSIMISSSLPRSSPAEFRTLSPASVLAARTRRYILSESVFSILLCIEMLLILLEPCTFDAYRASRARRCCSLLSIRRRGRSAAVDLFVNRHHAKVQRTIDAMRNSCTMDSPTISGCSLRIAAPYGGHGGMVERLFENIQIG